MGNRVIVMFVVGVVTIAAMVALPALIVSAASENTRSKTTNQRLEALLFGFCPKP